MATNRQCATCGAKLTDDAPDGQCPECLIQLGLQAGLAPTPVAPDAGFGVLPRELGDYELLEEIARGGMGVVFKARQKSLDRFVAVKLILSGHFAGQDSIHRFRTEASAAAALQHPNIVAIHEVGVHQGEHYLAMDLVEGPNLAQYVKNQPLPAQRAARYLKAIAEAIHYAHKRGILHRDLKPSNVLIDAHDQPRVTDFGLAKRIVAADVRRLTSRGTEREMTGGRGNEKTGQPPPPDPSPPFPVFLSAPLPSPEDQSLLTSAATEITLTGQVLGSPNYIPPEQASGKRGAITARSDVYSLGAILYHLLTGRGPFISDTVADTLHQVLHEEPVSPRLLNRSVPRDLETICLKCLEKEPARRYATAQALADELGRFLRHEPIHARPIGPAGKFWRWCRRKPALAALSASCVLAVALGFAGVLWQKAKVQRNLVRQYVANGTRLMNDGDLFGSLLWYTEALKLDQGSKQREEPHRIRIASVLQQCPRLLDVLTHDGPLYRSRFSPDGSKIITAGDDQTARIWDFASGKEPLTLRHDGKVFDVDFSPDGTRAVTAGQDRTVRVWDAKAGTQTVPPLLHDDIVWRACFSPDGVTVATGGSDGFTRIWNALTGERVGAPLPVKRLIKSVSFSANGRYLCAEPWDHRSTIWERVGGVNLSATNANWAYRSTVWDVATGKLLFTGVQEGATFDALQFSPDNSRFLAVDGARLHVWEIEGGKACSFSPLQCAGSILSSAFSPDGRLIVATASDKTTSVWDALTGQTVFSAVLQNEERCYSAVFSQDNRRLLTTGEEKSARVRSARNGRPTSPPLKHILMPIECAFNVDGRRLLTRSLDHAVRVWDLATAETKRLPGISSDGGWGTPGSETRSTLVRGASNSVSVTDASGSHVLAVLPHEFPVVYLSLSPDGRTVVTACNDEKPISYIGSSIFLWDARTGRRLNQAPMGTSLNLTHVAFSWEGDRVVACGQDATAQVWDARDGRPLTGLLRHSDKVTWAGFSPDRSQVLTACRDNVARVWEVATGLPLTPLMQHQSEVRGASWSADGRRVETLTETGWQTWDLTSGEPLTPPRGFAHGYASRNIGKPDERPVDDLVALARMLAASRVDARGNPMPLEPEELNRSWAMLRRKYPGQFAATPKEIASWHRREAADCEVTRDWSAVVFNLERALVATPEDMELRRWRDELASALQDPNRSKSQQLGLSRRIPPRDPQSDPRQVDLSAYFNMALDDVRTGLRNFDGHNTLPSGMRTFSGVSFDIRGVIHLAGQVTQAAGMELPKRVEGIKIGRKCRRLHFLQATYDWVIHDVRVGSYVFHYSNGERRELPIVYGRDIGRSWGMPRLNKAGEAVMIWPANQHASLNGSDTLRLFKSTRDNPLPDLEIVSIDFQSEMTRCAPFLLALTME